MLKAILIGLLSMLLVCAIAQAIPFGATVEPFPADVYPSQRAALIALASRCAAELPNTNYQIVLGTHLDGEMSDIFENAIQQTRKLDPHGDEMRDLTVSLADEQSHAASYSKATSRSGKFTATFEDGKSSRVLSTSFIEKPWADDWQMFMNADSSRRWLFAQTPTPATSAEEAVISARSAAKEILRQLVETELNARGAKLAELRGKMTPNWLDQRVIASLQRPQNDGILVRDTFVQKFSRPYGDVWQASVLIDASPKVIGDLADSYTSKAEHDFGAKAAGAIATFAMIGVLGLLYAFVNAVTKGYFMWRLRALAFLTAIAGILIVYSVV